MLIATCLLPPAAVALERTLDEDPETEVEVERIAAHSTQWTMPCLWISSPDPVRTEEVLAADPTVEAVVDAERFDGETFYHVEWAPPVRDRVDAFLDKQATILKATADARGWELQIRFADRDQFDAFRDHVDEEGYSFQLRHLTEPGDDRQTIGQLTPEQLEALRTAIEEGYFRVPREITTRELGAELDRSHQSVSELLRRGTENLVAAMLAADREHAADAGQNGDDT